MPIYNGLSQVNKAEIISDGKQMCRVYCKDKLVWQKIHEVSEQLGYGLLYNRPTLTDARGIAPSGFRAPLCADFDELINYCGWESGGIKLKESGFIHWDNENTGTNEYKFSGIGSGMRYVSPDKTICDFAYLKSDMFIHSSDIRDTWNIGDEVWESGGLALSSSGDYISNSIEQPWLGYFGFSVRLVKTSLSESEELLIDGDFAASITDFDGNIYPTVKIGNQIWTTKNLITKHYNNGDTIPNVSDSNSWIALASGAWCYHSNDPKNQ